MPSRVSSLRRWATVSVAALLFNAPTVADAAVCWWVPNHDKATDNQFTFVTTLPLSNHTCTSRPGPTVNLTNDAVEVYSRSVTSGLNAEFTWEHFGLSATQAEEAEQGKTASRSTEIEEPEERTKCTHWAASYYDNFEVTTESKHLACWSINGTTHYRTPGHNISGAFWGGLWPSVVEGELKVWLGLTRTETAGGPVDCEHGRCSACDGTTDSEPPDETWSITPPEPARLPGTDSKDPGDVGAHHDFEPGHCAAGDDLATRLESCGARLRAEADPQVARELAGELAVLQVAAEVFGGAAAESKPDPRALAKFALRLHEQALSVGAEHGPRARAYVTLETLSAARLALAHGIELEKLTPVAALARGLAKDEGVPDHAVVAAAALTNDIVGGREGASSASDLMVELSGLRPSVSEQLRPYWVSDQLALRAYQRVLAARLSWGEDDPAVYRAVSDAAFAAGFYSDALDAAYVERAMAGKRGQPSLLAELRIARILYLEGETSSARQALGWIAANRSAALESETDAREFDAWLRRQLETTGAEHEEVEHD